MKRRIYLIFSLLLILVLVVGCTEAKDSSVEKLPELSIGWGIDLHAPQLYMIAEYPEIFEEGDTYLKKISDKKFELIDKGEAIAIINQVEIKDTSPMELMAQGQLDAGIGSNTRTIMAIDQGAKLKILAPQHTGGLCLVFDPEYNLEGWDEVKKFIKDSDEPVKIGYHSPIAGPLVLFEHILNNQNIQLSENPADKDADVLLVNLKTPSNLIPSISGNHVQGWVGPSLLPELAEDQNLGKIAFDIDGFPPEGKWSEFPCCVFAATEKSVKKYPEVYEGILRLLDVATEYTKTNPEDSNKMLAEMYGTKKEVVDISNINYTIDPTDKWVSGIEIYVNALKEQDKFKGLLKDKSFDEIKDIIFDFSFIE